MGRIFEALRPHMKDFCDLVDPTELMRELASHLNRCDLEEVKAGLDSRGRQYANERLWQRLDGKVTLEQFTAALRRIGHHHLAARIEQRAPAANGEHSVALSPQSGTRAITVNNFNNCDVNVQQGNHNIVMETAQENLQQSFDSQEQISEPDCSYVVVTEDSRSRRSDVPPLTVGVVSHSDQFVPRTESLEYETSPKAVYIPDVLSDLADQQPLALLRECNGESRYVVGPLSVGASSSPEDEADVTLNDVECIQWKTAGLTAEDAEEQDTVRKSIDVGMAMHPVASADDDNEADNDDDDDDDDSGDDDAGNGNADRDDDTQCPVSDQSLSAERQAAAARLTESLESESIRHVETPTRVTEDSSDIKNDTSCADTLHDEVQNDALSLPASLSMPVIDNQLRGSSPRSLPAPSQHAATYSSWLCSTIYGAAQVYMYIYHDTNM